jgi:uncharacterized membrane protein
MENLLVTVAGFAALLIEAAAVLVVSYGAVEAIGRLAVVMVVPRATHGERKAIWRRFGMWLLLGLEFELAADIISTVVSPTWEDVGLLGAIALVRTFLNFFLERDLEHAEGVSMRRREPSAHVSHPPAISPAM